MIDGIDRFRRVEISVKRAAAAGCALRNDRDLSVGCRRSLLDRVEQRGDGRLYVFANEKNVARLAISLSIQLLGKEALGGKSYAGEELLHRYRRGAVVGLPAPANLPCSPERDLLVAELGAPVLKRELRLLAGAVGRERAVRRGERR